jgi:hypothetical protein
MAQEIDILAEVEQASMGDVMTRGDIDLSVFSMTNTQNNTALKASAFKDSELFNDRVIESSMDDLNLDDEPSAIMQQSFRDTTVYEDILKNMDSARKPKMREW